MLKKININESCLVLNGGSAPGKGTLVSDCQRGSQSLQTLKWHLHVRTWALPCPINLPIVLWGHRYYSFWEAPEEQERGCWFSSVLVPWESLLPALLATVNFFPQFVSHATNPCTFPLISEFCAVFGKTTHHICFKCFRIIILCSIVIKK